MNKPIVCGFLTLILFGCYAPVETSHETVEDFLNAMTYKKDPRTGLCFGVLKSSNFTGSDITATIQVVYVPCEKVEKFLK